MKNFEYIVWYVDEHNINRYVKVYAITKDEAKFNAIDNYEQINQENIIKVEIYEG